MSVQVNSGKVSKFTVKPFHDSSGGIWQAIFAFLFVNNFALLLFIVSFFIRYVLSVLLDVKSSFDYSLMARAVAKEIENRVELILRPLIEMDINMVSLLTDRVDS